MGSLVVHAIDKDGLPNIRESLHAQLLHYLGIQITRSRSYRFRGGGCRAPATTRRWSCIGRARSKPSRKGKVEACDVLLPDGTSIHVKHTDSSSPASHLLAQALVSAEILIHAEAAKRSLGGKIAEQGADPRDYRLVPKKVVIVMAEEGRALTADSLYTFTQVDLGRQDRPVASRDDEPHGCQLKAFTYVAKPSAVSGIAILEWPLPVIRAAGVRVRPVMREGCGLL